MPVLVCSGSEMTLPTALRDQWHSATHCSLYFKACLQSRIVPQQPTTPTSQLVLRIITPSHGLTTWFSFRGFRRPGLGKWPACIYRASSVHNSDINVNPNPKAYRCLAMRGGTPHRQSRLHVRIVKCSVQTDFHTAHATHKLNCMESRCTRVVLISARERPLLLDTRGKRKVK